MRQGQQNRRGRGRNHSHNQNGRKGHNPLTRSYESNGPDVKIRGTPAHVAEKYMSLARDAQSSGDPVLAENYLQHAEHYNRIIMAYRDQQLSQGGDVQNGQGGARPRPMGAGEGATGDDFGDEDGEEFAGEAQTFVRGNEPQPSSFDGQRQDDRPQRHGGGEGHRHQQHHHPRHQQHQHRDQRDRFGGEHRGYQGDRQERGERFERQDRGEPRADFRNEPRGERPQRFEQQAEGGADGGQRRRDRGGVPPHEQPEFLRRSVRRPRQEGEAESEVTPQATSATEDRD